MMGRGGGQTQSVIEDIFILNRIVTLQLTDEQVTSILDAYAKNPVVDDRVTKLLAIRQSLVQGNALTDADLNALRGVFQRGGPGQQPAAANTLSPLGQAIWGLLTEKQQAMVLAGGQGPGGSAQPWDRNRTLDFLTRLNTAMDGVDEAAWPAKRDAWAEAMAATAGAAGSPERANKKAIYVDFLDRMYQVPGADFEAKKQELAAGLEALVPDGNSLALIYAQLDPAGVVRAMDSSFLSYKAQGLLREIQAARAKPAP